MTTTPITTWTEFQPGDRIVDVRHDHTNGAFSATVERGGARQVVLDRAGITHAVVWFSTFPDDGEPMNADDVGVLRRMLHGLETR